MLLFFLYLLYNVHNANAPSIRWRGAASRQAKPDKISQWRLAMKYVCDVCGYEYDPEVGDPDNGIEPGTAWEDVPEDWVCPLCGVGKDEFSAEE